MQNSTLRKRIYQEQENDIRIYLSEISRAEREALYNQFYADKSYCILGTQVEFYRYVSNKVLGKYWL